MKECDNIIGFCENIAELYDIEGLSDIRIIAENIIENIDDINSDITVELYQNIKYTVDSIIEECEDYDFFDLVEVNCNDMMDSINNIRSFF